MRWWESWKAKRISSHLLSGSALWTVKEGLKLKLKDKGTASPSEKVQWEEGASNSLVNEVILAPNVSKISLVELEWEGAGWESKQLVTKEHPSQILYEKVASIAH